MQRYSFAQICALLNAQNYSGDPTQEITGVAALDKAQSTHLSFCGERRFYAKLATTNAGIVLIEKDAPKPTGAWIETTHPSLAFQKILPLFLPQRPLLPPGIDPTARIDTTASIDPTASIGPYVTIGAHTKIGPNTHIASHTAISSNVTIGARCTLYTFCAVDYGVTLKDNVTLQSHCVVGSDGFGYFPTPQGHLHLQQHGTVHLEDDVALGAHVTIDRGRFEVTTVGTGTKIDNHVHVGHGVQIGKHNLIAAHAAFAGSCTTGDFVSIGGQTGVAGHLHIGSHIHIGAQSGVTKSLTQPGAYAGKPALPLRDYLRTMARQRQRDQPSAVKKAP